LPKPRYPALARAAHISGQVTVQLLIDVDGTVMEAAAVSGHPLLYGVSVEAARNSRFSPTKLDGKPVKVTGVITYTSSVSKRTSPLDGLVRCPLRPSPLSLERIEILLELPLKPALLVAR
jgi:TonB family protein